MRWTRKHSYSTSIFQGSKIVMMSGPFRNYCHIFKHFYLLLHAKNNKSLQNEFRTKLAPSIEPRHRVMTAVRSLKNGEVPRRVASYITPRVARPFEKAELGAVCRDGLPPLSRADRSPQSSEQLCWGGVKWRIPNRRFIELAVA
jgi:hypothetical protein